MKRIAFLSALFLLISFGVSAMEPCAKISVGGDSICLQDLLSDIASGRIKRDDYTVLWDEGNLQLTLKIQFNENLRELKLVLMNDNRVYISMKKPFALNMSGSAEEGVASKIRDLCGASELAPLGPEGSWLSWCTIL